MTKVWCWPFISIQSPRQEWMELCLHFSICLHALNRGRLYVLALCSLRIHVVLLIVHFTRHYDSWYGSEKKLSYLIHFLVIRRSFNFMYYHLFIYLNTTHLPWFRPLCPYIPSSLNLQILTNPLVVKHNTVPVDCYEHTLIHDLVDYRSLSIIID